MVQMELYQFKNLLMEAAKLGASFKDQEYQPALDKISQRQAYEMFGEAKVKEWVNNDLVKPARSGVAKNSKRVYSLTDLKAAKIAEKNLPIINQIPIKPCKSSK